MSVNDIVNSLSIYLISKDFWLIIIVTVLLLLVVLASSGLCIVQLGPTAI